MKTLGITVLIIGILGVFAALGMNTSVSTGYGSVNNIGLMNDKQNYLIVCIGAVFLGFFMIVFDKSTPPPTAIAIKRLKKDATIERPDDPELLMKYMEDLGIYEQNGFYHFEKGKTKNLGTALMWAEAASARQ